MKKLFKPVLLTSILLSSGTAFKASACDTDPMLGSMCAFAFTFAPRGWALADGQLLPISSNSALFSLLGTTYGGDGRTSFALPDLRSRAVIGVGSGPGLQSYAWGQRVGVEWASLTMATMPSHGHSTTTASVSATVPTSAVTVTATLNGTATSGDSISPSASVFAQDVAGANAFSSVAPDVALSADSVSVSLSGSAEAGATQVQNSGGNQSHYNVMPYQTVSWAIAMQGVFPSRS